jgi:DNA mismatch repair ATPase MutL
MVVIMLGKKLDLADEDFVAFFSACLSILSCGHYKRSHSSQLVELNRSNKVQPVEHDLSEQEKLHHLIEHHHEVHKCPMSRSGSSESSSVVSSEDSKESWATIGSDFGKIIQTPSLAKQFDHTASCNHNTGTSCSEDLTNGGDEEEEQEDDESWILSSASSVGSFSIRGDFMKTERSVHELKEDESTGIRPKSSKKLQKEPFAVSSSANGLYSSGAVDWSGYTQHDKEDNDSVDLSSDSEDEDKEIVVVPDHSQSPIGQFSYNLTPVEKHTVIAPQCLNAPVLTLPGDVEKQAIVVQSEDDESFELSDEDESEEEEEEEEEEDVEKEDSNSHESDRAEENTDASIMPVLNYYQTMPSYPIAPEPDMRVIVQVEEKVTIIDEDGQIVYDDPHMNHEDYEYEVIEIEEGPHTTIGIIEHPQGSYDDASPPQGSYDEHDIDEPRIVIVDEDGNVLSDQDMEENDEFYYEEVEVDDDDHQTHYYEE